MTNAELIKALRNCSDGVCSLCPYDDHELSTKGCEAKLLHDAADALEELQSDWEYCSDMLNIAIRTTGISMTALVKLYEIECADGERRSDENH